VDAVETFCLSLRRELAGVWRRSDVFAAELVLREVMANAVEHGGRLDPGQTIAVRVTADGQRFRAKVSDHGSGFEAAAALGPSTAERGRGLRILDLYASAHAFEDGGRTVVFELPLRPAESKE
jgi:anti-sigma regulatory factor (Ser/Thr protein kinase)